jgi:hypothetical protein
MLLRAPLIQPAVGFGTQFISADLARRIGDQFGINYQWLMGTSDIQHVEPLGSLERSDRLGDLLPVISHLIDGEPRESPGWDGTAIAVTGAAAARAQSAHQPYILRVDHGDARGRLCKGDLILISQTQNS